jgi:hypothetical protein
MYHELGHFQSAGLTSACSSQHTGHRLAVATDTARIHTPVHASSPGAGPRRESCVAVGYASRKVTAFVCDRQMAAQQCLHLNLPWCSPKIRTANGS